jgi:ferredoxin-NADP reductase
MTYRYIVQDTVQVGDILLLTLAPRSSASRILFMPGQYAAISFTRNGRPTPMRSFSIVSTPDSGVLQFSMRIRGGFTRAAAGLHIGDVVRVQGAFGDFTIDPTYDNKVVLLAAGIGITPFISMLRDAAERQVQTPMTLLYTNRSATDIPFFEELNSLQRRLPALRIAYFASEGSAPEGSSARIIPGRITDEHIAQLCGPTQDDSTYFICGPGAFSDRMHTILRKNGIHHTRVLNESFSQTTSMKIGSVLTVPSVTYGLTAAVMTLAIVGIMVLDLSRTVPRLANAQAASQTQSTSPQPATTTMPTVTTQTTPTQTTQQTYQQPTSSVS